MSKRTVVIRAKSIDDAIDKLRELRKPKVDEGRGKLKLEHAVIPGLRPVLEKLLDNPAIRLIIPGRIVGIHGHTQLRIRITMPTVNGWKLTASIPSAAQEVFIGTTLTKEQLHEAISKILS